MLSRVKGAFLESPPAMVIIELQPKVPKQEGTRSMRAVSEGNGTMLGMKLLL
jgi:hypothetical protein